MVVTGIEQRQPTFSYTIQRLGEETIEIKSK